METALGLVGIAVFIVGILAFASAVTYSVIKIDAVIRARRRPSS